MAHLLTRLGPGSTGDPFWFESLKPEQASRRVGCAKTKRPGSGRSRPDRSTYPEGSRLEPGSQTRLHHRASSVWPP